MKLNYDWAYQDECEVEQGTINCGELNKTMIGPIKDECGVGQGRIYFGEWNKTIMANVECGVEY